MSIIVLSCAWVLGIFLGSKFHLPWVLCLAGLAPLVLLFFTRKYKKMIILAGLGIIVLVAAAAYAYSSLYAVDEGRLRAPITTRALSRLRAGSPAPRTSGIKAPSLPCRSKPSGWIQSGGMSKERPWSLCPATQPITTATCFR